MAFNYPWYTVVDDDTLEQGDFFFSCQVLEQTFTPTGANAASFALQANAKTYDVLILSQSCDLTHDKLETVLVCPHWPIEEFEQRSDFFRSSKGKEEIRRGNVPGLHMLAHCDLPEFKNSIRIVNFRQVFGLPFDYIFQLSQQNLLRLRLLPPYREHLAQAFARFIMRVGLPVDIPPFRK